VEQSLRSLSFELAARGHLIDILAPAGSHLHEQGTGTFKRDGNNASRGKDRAANPCLKELSGTLEQKAQSLPRSWEPAPPATGSFVAEACRQVAKTHKTYDLILNFSYDLALLELTTQLDSPVAHLISMGSLYDRFDQKIAQIAEAKPGRFACYSHSQAHSFPNPGALLPIGFGLDLQAYRFNPSPDSGLLWMGRISPEKGLEDALEVARAGNLPLRIAGKVENESYWLKLQEEWHEAAFRYLGFLATEDLQHQIGRSSALLMTPRWEEAFGIVAVEAMACGTPVVSYRRGGPSEIIQDGVTGFLTEPDQPEELLNAVRNISRIDRATCRKEAERTYSLDAWANRIEAWIRDILNREPSSRNRHA